MNKYDPDADDGLAQDAIDADPHYEQIEIAYGHPSGVVQAYHPESGIKQLGGSPGQAVAQLWRVLEQGGIVDEHEVDQ